MSDLEAIAALYQQLDNSLEDLREQHDAAGEAGERDRVARQQRLNEQAWFVLDWGQLEAEIGDACREGYPFRGNRKRNGGTVGRGACTIRTTPGWVSGTV